MIIYHFIIGAIIGSFLNVCIDRLPGDKSIMSPRSHCDKCGHTLSIIELIPVISYITLKGQCKICKSKISLRVPFIEVITGFAFAFIYRQNNNLLQILLLDSFVATTLVLTIIDLKHMLLPLGIINFGLITGIVIKAIQAIMIHDWTDFKLSLLGGLIGYLIFWVVEKLGSIWFKKECLGGGDIYLMSMIGFYVGIDYLAISLVIASFLALIYGIILLIKNKKSMPYPFGPFLNIGAYSVLFFGETILLYLMHYNV